MNNNIIFFSVYFIYVMYIIFNPICAINLGKIKNNMLRVYIYSCPKPIRKGILKKVRNFFSKSVEKTNIYLLEVNSSYHSLSEEDRLIIETIIGLNL